MSVPRASDFPNTWTRNVKEFAQHARMDAEHFQPHYEAIASAIASSKCFAELGSLLAYCKRGAQPKYVPAGEVLVLNSQHVGEHFVNVEEAERTSMEFWQKKPAARVQRLDVLINGTGLGTIGRANCVLHDAPTVVDNHVTVLRVKPGTVDPRYLAVFLNSPIGREQTYKWQSGSSGQLELYPADIRRFLILLPGAEEQARIGQEYEAAYGLICEAGAAAAAAEAATVSLLPSPSG